MGVTQFSITVNARMTEVANRSYATLQVFPGHLRTQKSALGRRLHEGQQQSGRKEGILMALYLRFGPTAGLGHPGDVQAG